MHAARTCNSTELQMRGGALASVGCTALQPWLWMACATAWAIAEAELPPCQKAFAMASAVASAAFPPSACSAAAQNLFQIRLRLGESRHEEWGHEHACCLQVPDQRQQKGDEWGKPSQAARDDAAGEAHVRTLRRWRTRWPARSRRLPMRMPARSPGRTQSLGRGSCRLRSTPQLRIRDMILGGCIAGDWQVGQMWQEEHIIQHVAHCMPTRGVCLRKGVGD